MKEEASLIEKLTNLSYIFSKNINFAVEISFYISVYTSPTYYYSPVLCILGCYSNFKPMVLGEMDRTFFDESWTEHNEQSEWCNVISGVPQGPIRTFVICHLDVAQLQIIIESFLIWSKNWLLNLSISKCKCVRIGISNCSFHIYLILLYYHCWEEFGYCHWPKSYFTNKQLQSQPYSRTNQ